MKVILAVCLSMVFMGCTVGRLHYFPKIKGKVLVDGESQSNASVQLITNLGWDTDSDSEYLRHSTFTDSDGRFIIPQEDYFGMIFPHPHIQTYHLRISHDSQVYVGFSGIKDHLNDDLFNGGLPLEVTCDLASFSSDKEFENLNGDRYQNSNAKFEYRGICVLK